MVALQNNLTKSFLNEQQFFSKIFLETQPVLDPKIFDNARKKFKTKKIKALVNFSKLLRADGQSNWRQCT